MLLQLLVLMLIGVGAAAACLLWPRLRTAAGDFAGSAWLRRTCPCWIHRALGVATPPTAAMRKAQLLQLVEEARSNGSVHPGAAEIALRALSFGDLTVADVMVPRHRVHGINACATAEEVRRTLLEEGHSCMPVYDGTLDQVVGVLVAKDVLALGWERDLIVLQDLLQPPYFAPEIMRAADLLKELQRRRMHFAVAVDELGGTAGIVTVEDLLEELVGEIYGEHDAQGPEPMHREGDGSVLVQGSVPLRDVNRELHLRLDEGDTWSTVGGLCISLAGRIPEAGNTLTCTDGTAIEVLEASTRRVHLVRLHQLGAKPVARGGRVDAGPSNT